MRTKLRIAIQKSGRLYEQSNNLLRECGISIENGKDQLKAQASNFPAEILYLRNDDIPQYIEDGVADIAIVGQNLVLEKQKRVKVIENLGFSKCRLSLAVPKEVDYSGMGFFNGKKIATSYPNSLAQFLTDKGITAEIHEISGSVEIAPNIGLADAICDLVSTGSTLFKNGLREVAVVLKSEAVLVANNRLAAEAAQLLNQLLFRLRAVIAAKNNKYVLLNAPNQMVEKISTILPGMRSPTVIPLAQDGWSSVHSVISENDFWQVLDELKEAGAEGILIIPIEKMVQ